MSYEYLTNHGTDDTANTDLADFADIAKNITFIKSTNKHSPVMTFIKQIDDIKIIENEIFDNVNGTDDTDVDMEDKTIIKESTLYSLEIPSPKMVSDIVIKNNILKNDKYSVYNTKITFDGTLTVISSYDNSDNTNTDKFANKKKSMIYIETADIYNKITEPSIASIDKKWIYNIIDGKKEQQRIIFQTDDFVILPDTSWVTWSNSGTSDVDDLYLLLIVKQKDIRSIRDLTGEHIPLLERMLKSLDNIENIYKIPSCVLRTYFHYKPSTWHLHLHINNINSNKLYSYSVERCHSLINVINNLKFDTDYYKKVDLQVVKNI